jgi:hypothetical protein
MICEVPVTVLAVPVPCRPSLEPASPAATLAPRAREGGGTTNVHFSISDASHCTDAFVVRNLWSSRVAIPPAEQLQYTRERLLRCVIVANFSTS